MNVGEPAGILFFVDQDVVRLRVAKLVQPDLHRAMVVVELDVEERLGIQCPDHATVGLLDQVGAVLARGPVAHPDREVFGALDVRTPGLQRMVRRMPGAAELEVFVVGGQLVAVKNDRGVAAIARGAAVLLMLPALAEFAQIRPRPVLGGHAGIVFLNAAAHLRHQLFLQSRRAAEQAVAIGVLGFEVAANLRIEDRGVAQHLLPFRILQPGIVVRHRDAMGGEAVRMAWRYRCGDRGSLLCHECSSREETIGLLLEAPHTAVPLRNMDIPWI